MDKYTYRTQWSEEDEAFICRCLEFPSLGTHGDTREEACNVMMGVVKESIEWLEEDERKIH